MSGGPGKTCQAHHDHHCSNNRPLALAAHSRTLNDFGSLEYPYRADRTEHNPDYRSHPHGRLHSRHKDRNNFVASPADGSSWRVTRQPKTFVFDPPRGNLRQQGRPQNRLRSGPVRVLIPIVVVDELDALKRGSSSRTRWRAGYSVVVIDRVTVDPPRAGILNPQHSMPPPVAR